MAKFKKYLLLILTVLSLTFGCFALASCDLFGGTLDANATKGIAYKINEDGKTASVVGSEAGISTLTLTDVVISSTYNGKPVTSIGEDAFRDCESLTSVVIPDSVTTIGDYAFYDCSSLTSITVDEDNQYDKSIDGNLYTKDGKTLVQYPIGKTATQFTVPDGVTTIGYYAFYDCSSLTSIDIPDSVTTIGGYAFCLCTSLKSAVIPDSVTTIGQGAFQMCTSLWSVVIGDGVTTIGVYAFNSCTSLSSVVIPDSVTSIGYGAFQMCRNLTSVVIGDSVTTIGASAFEYCDSLTSVVIPDSVTTIGGYAFRDCGSLKSVVIGDSVTTIGEDVFKKCYSLTKVYYKGTAADWAEIFFYDANEGLASATRYYYSETQPTASGNYWHYVNGTLRVWGKITTN